ncbi:Tankyrase-2 [Phytophthora citrophthora]|uniref:Tankyrase-2 n=1 Tax=Phytophthora citrophthora TaxID=4793 RepID=A0AAD9LCT1_9STRA|nr:Tankyrase-2 [Phytophthora citrophthora]
MSPKQATCKREATSDVTCFACFSLVSWRIETNSRVNCSDTTAAPSPDSEVIRTRFCFANVMELSKPTALAAFAAKQQLLDDLNVTPTAQMKLPAVIASNSKQLNPIQQSSSKIPTDDKLEPSLRPSLSLTPTSRLESTEADGVRDTVKLIAPASETTTKETKVSKTVAENESDDEEFKFEEEEDENPPENVKKVNVEEEESENPSEKMVNLPPPETEDVEDLYDCPEVNSTRPSEKAVSLREPKMFLPRASDIELFHVVQTQDIDQLEQYLLEIPPTEILEIVDMAGRNLYHYAALCQSKTVQTLVFQHVNSYRDAEVEAELQVLARKKTAFEPKGKDWIPPRVTELQREATKRKCKDWLNICSTVDENGRSLFHYFATTKSPIPIQDYEFCSVLRTQPNLLSIKDKFKKQALHYAVETGNLTQVKWHFNMGVNLSQVDVDLLLSFNVSRVMENVILRQLETMDIRNYYLPTPKDDSISPGASTFALAKLQRLTGDNTGRLHQLPLHRAAMFGNIRAVELLLEAGADPMARDVNLWTPLHVEANNIVQYCASEASATHLSIAHLLLESSSQVDVNAKSLKGRSPLHIAVRSNKHKNCQAVNSQDRQSIVAYLHECKADLDLKDNHGETPLLLACRAGDVGVVKFLLAAGCDQIATGDNKWNPLHYAGIVAIILIGRTTYCDYCLAIRGDTAIVRFLLSWDADSRLWIDSTGIQGRRPVDLAKSDPIRRMLTSLQYIEQNIWIESFNGNVEQVRRLIQRQYQQDELVSVKDKTEQTERTPLHLAILGYIDVLQQSDPKSTELKRTAPSRFLQTVVQLLQAGAELCTADKWGITPLMLAATIKDPILMETLLDRLPDEDNLLTTDTDGNTALHYSYAFCQAQISTMLGDHMDDEDVENKRGKTPFEITGSRDKIYPKDYQQFLNHQQKRKKLQRRRE